MRRRSQYERAETTLSTRRRTLSWRGRWGVGEPARAAPLLIRPPGPGRSLGRTPARAQFSLDGQPRLPAPRAHRDVVGGADRTGTVPPRRRAAARGWAHAGC